MKKLISTIISLIMLISLAGISVQASGVQRAYVEIENPLYSNHPVTAYEETSDITEEQADIIRNALRAAVNNRSKDLDVSEANLHFIVDSEGYASISGDVSKIIYDTLNDTPEYFFVTLTNTEDVTTQEDLPYFTYDQMSGCINTLCNFLTYRYSAEDTEKYADEINREAAAILREMEYYGASTDFDKALWLHDYLASNLEYSYEADGVTPANKHWLDDALLDRKAVCQGYSIAYKYLLNKCGVECENVYDTTDGHEWSMVKIDDEWYHVDITFDDPSPDKLGTALHSYFLLTDEEILDENHIQSHHSWYTTTPGLVCTDTRYTNAIWKTQSIDSPIAFTGNDRYYVSTDNSDKFCIYKADRSMENAQQFSEIDTYWVSPDGKFRYSSYYGGMGALGKYLFYNKGKELVRVDTETGLSDTLLTYTGSGSLFGSYVSGGYIHYATGLFKDAGNNRVIISTDNENQMTLAISSISTEGNISMNGNHISGNISASLASAIHDEPYMYLAIYNNSGVLEKILLGSGDFDIDIDVANPNEKYTYKIFAWNGSMLPCAMQLDGRNISVQ